MAPVPRWGRTRYRFVTSQYEKILNRIGTNEPIVVEPGSIALHCRKPLRIEEINRMAPTQEVRRREGRP